MPKINNWSITSSVIDVFTAPECRTVCLQGNVTGHLRFEDGEHIYSSPIVGVEKREILTESGTIYKLGKIDRRFRNWLRKNRPNWDWRNPITYIDKKKKGFK